MNREMSRIRATQFSFKTKIKFPIFKIYHIKKSCSLDEKFVENRYSITNIRDEIVKLGKLFPKDFQYELKALPDLSTTSIKNIIFDINKVLLNFDKIKIKAVEKELRMILKNPIWPNYLNGTLNKEEAILKLSNALNFTRRDIEKVIDEARDSFYPIEENINLLKQLKKQGKNLICLSNCPKDEIELVRRRFNFFDNFDIIFSSGDIGVNKPSEEAFKTVLNYCNLVPEETIYLDDDSNNISTAKSLGIKSIVYKDSSSLREIEELLINDQINDLKSGSFKICTYSKNLSKSYHYITKAADLDINGLFTSKVGFGEHLINPRQSPSELASSAIILDLSKQLVLSSVGNKILSLMKNICKNGKFKNFLNLDVLPYDCNTSSLILALLYKHNLIDTKTIHLCIDEILNNHNEDKVILTYFDKNRQRVCPIVCTHAMLLIYSLNRENNPIVQSTKNYIFKILKNKQYQNGNYYINTDLFLFSVSKLVYRFPDNFSEFKETIINELKERKKSKNDALSLACRIICCNLFDIPNNEDIKLLLNLQMEDGSFPESPIYSTNREHIDVYYWANRALSTAFGMKAIEMKIFGKKQFI